MLLTEDEAKTKGCPYKPMTYVTLGYVEEAVPQGVRFDTCSGSECMGWRAPEEYDGEAGYCGLAGRVTE